MFNNVGTPLSKLQINFGGLQIDTENSAIGLLYIYIFLYGRISIYISSIEDNF